MNHLARLLPTLALAVFFALGIASSTHSGRLGTVDATAAPTHEASTVFRARLEKTTAEYLGTAFEVSKGPRPGDTMAVYVGLPSDGGR